MVRWRNVLASAAIGVTFVVAGCATTSSHASSPTPLTSLPAALYVQQGTKLAEWNPVTKKYGAALPHISTTNLWSVAANNHTVFWTQLVDGTHTDLYSMPRTGGAVTVLARDVEPSGLLAATKDRLYWAGSAIWSMPIDGSTQPKIVLDTHSRDGAAADGLAVDNKYLYFSQCDSDRIGRIAQSGKSPASSPTWLAHPYPCPRGITVTHGFVYFDTDYGDAISRVTVDGKHSTEPWVRACATCVLPYPFPGSRLTAFGDALYWVDQNQDIGPAHLSRVRLDKSGHTTNYMPVAGPWIFAAPAN